MSISFNCESCKKKIKAPDGAGGKWGKCPHCNHKCYIPSPRSDDDEELTLKPIDEMEESRMHNMMRETHNLTKNLLHESALPDDGSGHSNATASEKEVIKKVILYLRQIADGELDQAERTFHNLKSNKKTSLRILASMGRADQPEPELSDIPDNVLQGLIHKTSSQLS